jgi:hypothetical protein
MQVLLYALIAVGYILFLTVAVLLIKTYLRTRDVGFIWLGVAVLVWPLVVRFLGVAVERGGVGPFPITGQVVALVQLSQQICSLGLLLVAIRHLGKMRPVGYASN